MTGRDLIIYILQNHIEDVEINPNDIGFITVEQAAVKFNVGEATIRAWMSVGLINTYSIGSEVYLEDDFEDPRLE